MLSSLLFQIEIQVGKKEEFLTEITRNEAIVRSWCNIDGSVCFCVCYLPFLQTYKWIEGLKAMGCTVMTYSVVFDDRGVLEHYRVTATNAEATYTESEGSDASSTASSSSDNEDILEDAKEEVTCVSLNGGTQEQNDEEMVNTAPKDLYMIQYDISSCRDLFLKDIAERECVNERWTDIGGDVVHVLTDKVATSYLPGINCISIAPVVLAERILHDVLASKRGRWF